MKSSVLLTAFVCMLASSAFASDPWIRVDLTVTEVIAGTTTPVANPNGHIAPGEAAMIEAHISFYPPVGTIIPTQWGDHPVVGFGTMAAHLIHWGGGEFGTWSDLALATGWIPAGYGSAGSASSHQSVNNIWAGQGSLTPGWSVNPANPIPSIWRGVWTPSTYDERTVRWQMVGASFPTWVSLYVQVGTDPTTGHAIHGAVHMTSLQTINTPLDIHIIPAPGTALVVFVGMGFAARRRR